MPFRFHRSVKILPGVRLHIGKTGIGVSAGARGFHIGRDVRGKTYLSAGIPGTGVGYRKTLPRKPDRSEYSAGEEYSAGSTARLWIAAAVVAIVALVLMALTMRQ